MKYKTFKYKNKTLSRTLKSQKDLIYSVPENVICQQNFRDVQAHCILGKNSHEIQ